MLGIQFIAIIFSMFMIYLTFLYWKRKQFTIPESLMWVAAWIVVMFFALFPNPIESFVEKVISLERPLDFYIICGFLFLAFISFFNYSRIRKTQQNVERIVSTLTQEKKL